MTSSRYYAPAPSRWKSRAAAAIGIGAGSLLGIAAFAPGGLHVPQFTGSPATAAIAGTTAGGGHATAGRGGGVALTSMPSGGSYDQASWARAFLQAAGFRATGCNIGAVEGWERAEGSNMAWRNPLDTTRVLPGVSKPIPGNTANVQIYPTWQTGFQATVITIRNGHYGAVEAALRRGNDAQRVADAVAGSVWGTEPFTAHCVASS